EFEKQALKWQRLVSLGEAVAEHKKKDSLWIRSSEGRDYLKRPGFKSERSITLANEDVCQVFSEVIKPQLLPLFKYTCEKKSVRIISTKPTQAANSVLKELGLQTNKHWSGRLVSWLGILSVGEDPPCDDGTDRTLWSYGSGENVVPLRPGYDARLILNSEGTSFEIFSFDSSRSHNFGPIFQCAVISGEDNLYTTQEVKPTTPVRNVLDFLKIKEYKKNISGYEFFGFQRPDVIKQLQALAKVCRKRQLYDDLAEFTTINDTTVIKRKFVSQYPLLDKVANTKTRNAGPTNALKPHARKERNTLVHEMVKFTSSNDVQSYFVCL
ncbi:Hypothetical predicted protein, partial [Paramuricea clavata]